MSRMMLRTAVLTTLLSTWLLSSGYAQTRVYRVSGEQPARFPGSKTPVKRVPQVRPGPGASAAQSRLHRFMGDRSRRPSRQTAHYADRSQSGTNGARQPGPSRRIRKQYPNLNASMYPAPRPDIPHQMGGAVITNQALSPHEMMHPHEYRALYPPFYYKVSGRWVVMPGGVWTREKWELKGTEVNVKYHSRIGLLSLFSPPAVR